MLSLCFQPEEKLGSWCLAKGHYTGRRGIDHTFPTDALTKTLPSEICVSLHSYRNPDLRLIYISFLTFRFNFNGSLWKQNLLENNIIKDKSTNKPVFYISNYKMKKCKENNVVLTRIGGVRQIAWAADTAWEEVRRGVLFLAALLRCALPASRLARAILRVRKPANCQRPLIV